jgi:homeobox protein cut-like
VELEIFFNYFQVYQILTIYSCCFQISLLIEEIARLRTAIQALQESHNVQIQRLEESLDAKRQHISRLENRIGKSDFDDMKKENR